MDTQWIWCWNNFLAIRERACAIFIRLGAEGEDRFGLSQRGILFWLLLQVLLLYDSLLISLKVGLLFEPWIEPLNLKPFEGVVNWILKVLAIFTVYRVLRCDHWIWVYRCVFNSDLGSIGSRSPTTRFGPCLMKHSVELLWIFINHICIIKTFCILIKETKRLLYYVFIPKIIAQ